MAADSEISLLTRGSKLFKATCKTWSSQPAEEEEEEQEDGDKEVEQPSVKFLPPEGGIPSPLLRSFESEPSSIHAADVETKPSDATQERLSLSFNTSQMSVRSTDTTLEYYDAPLSEEQTGEEGHTAEEVVTINIKGLAEKEEPEVKPSPNTEQTALLTTEDPELEEETFEDVMEIGLEQEAKNEEEVQTEKEEDHPNVEARSEQQEDVTIPDQEEMATQNQGNSFICLSASYLLHTILQSTTIQPHMF